MSYLDDYLKLGTNQTGSTTPYTSSYSLKPSPTFEDIDAASAAGLPSPYTTSSTPAPTTTSSGTTSNVSSLNSTISSPLAPKPVTAPTYDQSLRNMYVETFNNPETYWDEYSQGQGVQFTNNAARGMAKAGRTGMLPALNTLAHQDYMSNYLPSVRKDMAPGLSYESAWNQNLQQQYGDELGYSQGIYGQDISKYGHELDYDSAMSQLAQTASSDAAKLEVDKLNAALRDLEIAENTKVNLTRDLTTIFKDLSAEEQAIVTNQLLADLGVEGYGAKTLEELLADSPSDTAYNSFYDGYVG